MMAWILKSEILILFKQEGEPTNRGEIYSDLEELKNYVMAQMLWDPTQDPQRLSADFLRFYCERSLTVSTNWRIIGDELLTMDGSGLVDGPAAGSVAEYMAAIEAAVQATNATVQTIPHPSNPCNVRLVRLMPHSTSCIRMVSLGLTR